MIYTFECAGSGCDGVVNVERSIKEGPPDAFLCPVCEEWAMERVWHPPQLLLRGDVDDVGVANLLADNGGREMSKSAATRKERAYQRHIEERRKVFRDNQQVGGRLTHQVPTELYHAKIKQTGDKDYWRDPANLNRHSSCKVS